MPFVITNKDNNKKKIAYYLVKDMQNELKLYIFHFTMVCKMNNQQK